MNTKMIEPPELMKSRLWPFVVDGHFFGQVLAHQLFEISERFTERVAVAQVGFERDRAHAVETRQRLGGAVFGNGHQVGERNELAGACRTHVDAVQVAERASLRARLRRSRRILRHARDRW